MFASGIILAAGSSTRFGEDKLMQVLPTGKTVLEECISKFVDSKVFSELILVNNPKRDLTSQLWLNKLNVKIVSGGGLRQESAFCGIKATSVNSEILCIHDAVRPFVSIPLIKECVSKAEPFGACIPVLKVTDTIKEVANEKVTKTLNRDVLFKVQTPQSFLKDKYLKAHKEFANKGVFSDDAGLFELAGFAVHTIKGEERNIKITTKEDMLFANFIIRSQKQS